MKKTLKSNILHKQSNRLQWGASMIAMVMSASPAFANTEKSSAPGAAKPSPSETVAVQLNKEDEFKIRFRADTLVISPVLSASLKENLRTAIAGEKAEFQTYSNYPAFIERGEIRIFSADAPSSGEPLATIEVDANGYAAWDVPSDGESALYFIYRAYGKDGKFDETAADELTIITEEIPHDIGCLLYTSPSPRDS